MNGEQKGGVKNHFQTLFRIIKNKLKRKKEIELEKKNEEKKVVQKKKTDDIIQYNVNYKLQTKKMGKQKNNAPSINPSEIKPKEIKTEALNKKQISDNVENNSFVLSKEKTKKDSKLKGIKLKKGKKAIVSQSDKILNVKKDNNLEESIIKRINKIISDDKQDIDSLKYKLYEIDKEIYNSNDVEQLNKIRKQFEVINEKIEKIKKDFEIIKDNLDFEQYNELNNYFLIEEIEDFKFDSNLESIELLSLKCKQQIESLEDIVIVYENATRVSKKIDTQENTVEYFDKNSELINEKSEELDFVSKKINNNIELQNKFINDMNKKIGVAQKEVKIFYKYQGINELLNNTLMMGLGLYSYSSMRKPRFKGLKFLIGSFLMYNSIRGMFKFLVPEAKRITYIYYQDYAKELESESSRITMTHNLLNRSIKDIDILKREFKTKFMEYQYQFPEYDSMLEKIDKIKNQLKLQKKELDNIDKKVEEQKARNKEYVKRIEKIEE